MRDTFVLLLFALFISSGTFLAYTGKVEPQLIMTPIITGFLGLLASTRPRTNGTSYHQEYTIERPKSFPDLQEKNK